MSTAERQRYINAWLTVSTTPPYKAQFDSLVNTHYTQFGNGIHMSSLFFPWHRWFLLEMENLLRKIDCRITIPYWDWTKNAVDPWNSPLWGSGSTWFGGSNAGNCVNNGAFVGWLTASGVCLKRNFVLSASLGTQAQLQATISANALPTATSYSNLRAAVEAGPGFHNSVHCAIGATMCASRAAEAPEFWLVHAFVDKIWFDWQSISPAHVLVYSGLTSAVLPGSGGMVVNKAINPANHYDMAGNAACVKYVNHTQWWWLDIGLLQALSPARLLAIPRSAMTPSASLWMINAMNMSRTDTAVTAVLRNEAVANKGALARSTLLLNRGQAALTGLQLTEETLKPLDGQIDLGGCVNDAATDDATLTCATEDRASLDF
jgi:hypothetical protein